MKEQSNNTLFIGKVAIHLSSVNSTNLFAHELISKTNPSEGTVIRADEQYAGRGQFGSSWSAKPGENITISILLNPRFLLAGEQFLLSQTIALALCDFIGQFDLPEKVSIKWPNDIYVGKNKIAGVLIENILKGVHLNQSIIGIGINVNQDIFDPSIPNPTSLFLQTQNKYEIDHLLFQLYESVERHYLRLKSNDFGRIRESYFERLFQAGLWKDYYIKSENKIINARITGVDKTGKLELDCQGEIKSFDLKEIGYIF
jgi:BirA family biotin operon repressor/biotin-[acetyl-CoA-carboxylase] ligase